jgi:hypothetical protein
MIEYLMTEFRMGAVHSTVEFSINKDSPADAGADCDINKGSARRRISPIRFAQRGRIGVVLNRDREIQF